MSRTEAEAAAWREIVAAHLARLVESFRKTAEIEDLERRIEALEGSR